MLVLWFFASGALGLVLLALMHARHPQSFTGAIGLGRGSGLAPHRWHCLTRDLMLGSLPDILPPGLKPPVLARELPQAHADVLLLPGYGVSKPGVLWQHRWRIACMLSGPARVTNSVSPPMSRMQKCQRSAHSLQSTHHKGCHRRAHSLHYELLQLCTHRLLCSAEHPECLSCCRDQGVVAGWRGRGGGKGDLSAARFQRSSSLPAMVMRPWAASSLAHRPMRRSMPATPSPVWLAALSPAAASSASSTSASGSGVLDLLVGERCWCVEQIHQVMVMTRHTIQFLSTLRRSACNMSKYLESTAICLIRDPISG